MRPHEVTAWLEKCEEERRALDYDPRTRFLDESVREYIESLEEERDELREALELILERRWGLSPKDLPKDG